MIFRNMMKNASALMRTPLLAKKTAGFSMFGRLMKTPKYSFNQMDNKHNQNTQSTIHQT